MKIQLHFFLLLICPTYMLTAQLEVEQLVESNVNMQLGKRSLLTGSNILYMNSNSLWSKTNGLQPLSAPLRLNPNGNGVTVGTSIIDVKNSALSINNSNVSSDLHLGGRGQVATNGSFFLQMNDDNTNGDELFQILNGDDETLFRIEENNSEFNGDILIDGRLIKQSETFHQNVHYSEFEVISDSGDCLEADGFGVFNNCGSSLGASIKVPHGAKLKKISAKYYDMDPDGYSIMYLEYSPYNLLNIDQVTHLVEIYDSRSGSSQSAAYSVEKILNNLEVDLLQGKYYIRVFSSDWAEQRVNSVIVEYIY